VINASLGAHYSNSFVWLSFNLWLKNILHLPIKDSRKDLSNQLQEMFSGQTILTYKGRDAIELALQGYNINKATDAVLTQAFTCSAIEEGIRRAGATTVYVDIGKGQLNLSVETLAESYKNLSKKISPKAVLVQHSLGHPAEIDKIAQWCKEKNLLLIEDLAQAFGGKNNDQFLGAKADVVILSFGRDKVIDAVGGGAVVFKKKPIKTDFSLTEPEQKIINKDLLYPLFTWFIRLTFPILIGRLLHLFLKKINWLSSPVFAQTKQAHQMPKAFAPLVVEQLKNYQQTLEHRRSIASYYLTAFTKENIPCLTKNSNLENGSLLRIALKMKNPLFLIDNWKKEGIHLSDRWYRQAVDCGSKECNTNYIVGSCPNAEYMSQHIINLPTHQKISLKDAIKIVRVLKKQYSS